MIKLGLILNFLFFSFASSKPQCLNLFESSYVHFISQDEVANKKIRNAFKSVYRIYPKGGSGFFLKNGVFLTAGHNISENDKQYILVKGKKIYLKSSNLLFLNNRRSFDLAVFQFSELKSLRGLSLEVETPTRNSQISLTGFPFNKFSPLLNQGKFFKWSREDKVLIFELKIPSFIGHSGGPVLDSEGHVIGLLFSGQDKKDVEFLSEVRSDAISSFIIYNVLKELGLGD